MISKVHICDANIAYLDDKAHFGSLTLWFALFQSCHLLSLSKILKGNICNWLLQGNGVITRVLAYCQKTLQDESDRGLIRCFVKFYKPLNNIRKVASLARNSSMTSTWCVFFDLLNCYSHIALYVTNVR